MTAFPATEGLKALFDPEVLLGTGRAWLGRIDIWQRWHHSVLCTKCRISCSYAEEEPEAVWYGGATEGMGWGLGGIASRETAPTPGLAP